MLIDDPPYLLDAHLNEPAECWCRIELLPEAGASTVSLTVMGLEGEDAPPVEDVRDVLIASLGQLGRWEDRVTSSASLHLRRCACASRARRVSRRLRRSVGGRRP